MSDRCVDRWLDQVQIVVSPDPIEVIASQLAPEAIVSSDDTDLSMSGATSKAIARIAGRAMVEEARRMTPCRYGAVVTTSGGSLPARYILHAVTVDWHKELVPTGPTIRNLAREVFVRCEALDINSIAIPAFGTGAGGYPVERSAELIVEALSEHVRHTTVLQKVIFPLPDEVVRGAFLRHLANVERDLRDDRTSS
jgi:O-acetyl-ADP-ribose deacetylase (regulator of RNase III)